MTWLKGKIAVQGLIDLGEVERVPPSSDFAERLLSEAERHIASAALIAITDSSGCLDLAYHGARKACFALLAIQGLRPTSQGGHVALGDAVIAQFGEAFKAFHRLRRGRNDSEYPSALSPSVSLEDAEHAVETAGRLIDGARSFNSPGQLSPF
jgi:hypothetical protein